MKLLFLNIALIIFVILQSFCGNKQPHDNGYFPTPTTLDSLQGSWVNQNDTTNQMLITGRNANEINIDTATRLIHKEYFTIYFSDTVVNRYLEQDMTTININKTSLTGNYLVKISNLDSSVWCYQINGFHQDTAALTFSMSDVWAHRVRSLYKKI